MIHHPHHEPHHWRHDRIGSARIGENPTVLVHLPGGFASMGDVQFLPGYCVLLTDQPGITRLSELASDARADFLESMARLADAVERACGEADLAFRRVNIEILGNTDPFLHAHIWPRYGWEDAELAGSPVWLYPSERWDDPDTALGTEHAELRAEITRLLTESGPVVP
jgi:diadenosine tetraphosphate (Ap4A) HIT family hydrolase